jgi:hypothetical protein
MNEANSLQHVPGIQPVHSVSKASIIDDDRWATVWFTLMEHAWTSLVLVPADKEGSAVPIAWALAEFGRPYQEDSIYVLNAERVSPADVPGVVDALRDGFGLGARVLVAVNSPLARHATIPVARAADAAVLLVELGRTDVKSARYTIDSIGAGCFVGSIAI